MAKNKTKQAKFKNVVFKVQKRDFKSALDNVLMHAGASYINSPAGVLNSVKIHVESDYMELLATDSNTLLKATVGLDEAIKGKGDILLDAKYLSKIKLVKDYKTTTRDYSVFDLLEIVIKETEAQITDIANGVTYTIPRMVGQYPPNVEDLLAFKYDEKKYLEVAINPNFIAKLKNLVKTNGFPVVMYFEKENPLAMIHVIANGGAQKAGGYDAVIMPCQIRE